MDTISGAYELNHKRAMKHLERVLKFVRTPHIFAVSWSCYIPHISSYYLLSRIRSGCLTVCDVYVFPVSKEGRFRLAVTSKVWYCQHGENVIQTETGISSHQLVSNTCKLHIVIRVNDRLVEYRLVLSVHQS